MNFNEHRSDTGKEFARLLSKHRNSIYSFILTLVANWSDAEDLMQETAEVMWSKYHQSKPINDFLSWSLAIAKNKALNFHRQNKKRKTYLSPDAINDIADITSKRSKDLDRRIEALKKCVKKIPEDHRRFLKMRYEHEAPLRILAEHFNKSITAVYKTMGKIHKILLECIRRNLAEMEA